MAHVGKRRKAPPRRIGADDDTQPAAFDVYLRELRRHPMMSREEERAVALRAQAGDDEARAQLITANLRFVVSFARKWKGRRLSIEELTAAGNGGMVRAVDLFDPTRGHRFLTFARWHILAAMQEAQRHAGLLSVSPGQAANGRLVMRATDLLFTKLGREPTAEEIAQVTGLTPGTVTAMRDAAQRAVSLDAPLRDEAEGASLQDLIADPAPDALDLMLIDEEAATIDAILADLPHRDQRIVRLYFGLDGDEPATLEAIGAELGITRERVRQLRDRAFKRIRSGGDWAA